MAGQKRRPSLLEGRTVVLGEGVGLHVCLVVQPLLVLFHPVADNLASLFPKHLVHRIVLSGLGGVLPLSDIIILHRLRFVNPFFKIFFAGAGLSRFTSLKFADSAS